MRDGDLLGSVPESVTETENGSRLCSSGDGDCITSRRMNEGLADRGGEFLKGASQDTQETLQESSAREFLSRGWSKDRAPSP